MALWGRRHLAAGSESTPSHPARPPDLGVAPTLPSRSPGLPQGRLGSVLFSLPTEPSVIARRGSPRPFNNQPDGYWTKPHTSLTTFHGFVGVTDTLILWQRTPPFPPSGPHGLRSGSTHLLVPPSDVPLSFGPTHTQTRSESHSCLCTGFHSSQSLHPVPIPNTLPLLSTFHTQTALSTVTTSYTYTRFSSILPHILSCRGLCDLAGQLMPASLGKDSLLLPPPLPRARPASAPLPQEGAFAPTLPFQATDLAEAQLYF